MYMARAQGFGLSSAFSRVLAERLIGSRQPRLKVELLYRMHCKLWLNLLCHNTDPSLLDDVDLRISELFEE